MNYILILAFAAFVIGIILLAKHLNNKEGNERPLPYRAKPFIFTRSELMFLQVLHEHVDKKKYMIFPKIRLADFVEVTAVGKEYQACLNKIKSKHVDYLIWNAEENKVVLVIELDGNSHNTQKGKDRDEFVNALYTRIGIRIERVRVGSDFVDSIKSMGIGEETASEISGV